MPAYAKILVFGGTSEGRLLCEAFSRSGREVSVCTATEYGAALMEKLPHVRAHGGRLDADGMAGFIRAGAFDTVIDATHPYAEDASRNIREACERAGGRHIRVIREDTASGGAAAGVRAVPDMDSAVDYLATKDGNALLTTGSKELARFCRLPGYGERLYVRVLPDAGVIAECNALGFRGGHVIAMQGPFSQELNAALLRHFGCVFLVTKSSGRAGGLDAKISAAREAGAEVVLVARREREAGLTLDETLRLLGLARPAAKEAS